MYSRSIKIEDLIKLDKNDQVRLRAFQQELSLYLSDLYEKASEMSLELGEYWLLYDCKNLQTMLHGENFSFQLVLSSVNRSGFLLSHSFTMSHKLDPTWCFIDGVQKQLKIEDLNLTLALKTLRSVTYKCNEMNLEYC